MRRFIWSSLALILAVLVCGCTQPVAQPPATTPATPAPITTPPQVTLPPATPVTATVQKQINFNVSTTTNELIVQYNGGPDAADLTALKIRVDNYNSQDVERLITYPVIGSKYIFTYQGVADPNVVNIIGVFRDGYEQTVLMYYV